MEMRFVPMAKPFAPRQRRHSPFKATFSATLKALEKELRHLGAKDVVIEADCERDQLRLDGLLRVGARLRSPGIVLSFNSKSGPLRFPCDTYMSHESNLRAITLSLAALRTVDRYGVTKKAEQYQGWQALPPTNTEEFTSPEAAIVSILHFANATHLKPATILAEANAQLRSDMIREVWKVAMKKNHPDTGGDPQAAATINRAMQYLEKAKVIL